MSIELLAVTAHFLPHLSTDEEFDESGFDAMHSIAFTRSGKQVQEETCDEELVWLSLTCHGEESWQGGSIDSVWAMACEAYNVAREPDIFDVESIAALCFQLWDKYTPEQKAECDTCNFIFVLETSYHGEMVSTMDGTEYEEEIYIALVGHLNLTEAFAKSEFIEKLVEKATP